jgi:hypothetical protein
MSGICERRNGDGIIENMKLHIQIYMFLIKKILY